MIELSQIKSDAQDSQVLRKFGIAVGGIIAIVFGILVPLAFGHGISITTTAIGTLLVMMGILLPKQLKWAYIGWMVLAATLGMINTKILLSLVYFLVIFPIGLIWRVNRVDKLAIKSSRDDNSFLNRIDSGSAKIDMTAPF